MIIEDTPSFDTNNASGNTIVITEDKNEEPQNQPTYKEENISKDNISINKEDSSIQKPQQQKGNEIINKKTKEPSVENKAEKKNNDDDFIIIFDDGFGSNTNNKKANEKKTEIKENKFDLEDEYYDLDGF